MPVTLTLTEKIVADAAPLALSSFFAVSGTADPAYLVVTAFDRDAYAAGATGAVGAFSGNGVRLALTPGIGNARVASIVFTWTAAGYVNAVSGSLSALTYIPSASAGDVTTLSVFTTSSQALATQDAANPLALAQADPTGNIGSATNVTDAHPFMPPAGAGVTPDGIAAAAQAFVGRAWNDQGCWGLASTIAAEAGAGLPITATALGVRGHASGAWVVVYDGPAHASANWADLVTVGDVITFGTPGGGGHITTCVAGTGASALLIDNAVYQNAQGRIANAANDGAPGDVLVAPAHPAAQEFAGVAADSVVIYALDTPVVTARAGAPAPGAAATKLSAYAAISDPGGRPITRVQVYEPGQGLSLMLGGIVASAGSAADALSAPSLAAISVEGGMGALEIRAFNGMSWGDWQDIVIGEPQAMSAPASMAGGQVGEDILRVAWHHHGFAHRH